MIEEFCIDGYRSIRHLRLPLSRVTVVTGANGCGKSNLYKALYLLGRAAHGDIARLVAQEGGLRKSVMWAGDRKTHDAYRVQLSVSFHDWSYDLAFGEPAFSEFAFAKDLSMKTEHVYLQQGKRRTPFLKRDTSGTHLRDHDGALEHFSGELDRTETALAEIRDAHSFPELYALRDRICAWRFYHHFPTGPDAPMRRPQPATHTPRMADDGSDLASALGTLEAVDPRNLVAEFVERAFPGARLEVEQDDRDQAFICMHMPNINRPLHARELSDGTLRYFCLLAALLGPRPAEFLVLNEPETSLHEDLLPPLAQLIVAASEKSQILVVTHSRMLSDLISAELDARPVSLFMEKGETKVEGHGLLDW